MTYLAAFYMGRIIKGTAALVHIPQRVFSPWIHSSIAILLWYPQILHLLAVSLLAWEKQTVQCSLLGFAEGTARSARTPCALAGVNPSLWVQSDLASSQVGVQKVSKS